MLEESLVNGVWYHILSQAFPFPRYIIAPEYRTDDGRLRGDLFVIRVDPDGDPQENKAVFAFEGKREGSKTLFDAARTQLWGYLKNITQGGTRGKHLHTLRAVPSISGSHVITDGDRRVLVWRGCSGENVCNCSERWF
jgi:hypothetical protein